MARLVFASVFLVSMLGGCDGGNHPDWNTAVDVGCDVTGRMCEARDRLCAESDERRTAGDENVR